MNKYFITTAIALLICVSTTAQVKKIAILEPVGSAENHIKNIVLEEVYYISKTYGDISIIEKQTVSNIIDTHNFQIDILTEDSKIGEICKVMKVRYAFLITVADVGKNNYSVSCKIIDVVTANTIRHNFTQTRNGLSDLVINTQQMIREMLDSMEILFKQKEKELDEVQTGIEKELAEQKTKEERELAETKAKEEAKLIAEEEARLKAEEEARLIAEEEARLIAEEEARLIAEEEARLIAEEEARLIAEEEARLIAEEEARIMQQQAKMFLDQLPDTVEFLVSGGTETFSAHYFETSWNELDIPSWCNLQKTSNSLSINCETNPNTYKREGSFFIQAGNQFKKIWIIQKPKIFLALSDTVIEFQSSGGTAILAVLTNASSWSTSKDIAWCPVSKSDTSIVFSCNSNPSTIDRSDKFTVSTDKESKTVQIKQQGITYLEKGSWKQAINKVMYNGAITYENGLYRGEKSNRGTRTGLGAYLFISDIESYWGDFLQGESSGKGMYIIGKDGISYFSGCWGCKYYAGDWSSDMKTGLGKCYDSRGDLLYFGYFHNDKPIEPFPQNCDTSYKFECIEYDNGDIYLGETHNGIKEGQGIFFGAGGDAWYGEWKDGIRNGSGIEFLRDGSIKTGRWIGEKN